MSLFARTDGAERLSYHQNQFKSLESFNHDGLEIARRHPGKRVWPWRHALYLALLVVAFKSFLFLELGAAAYGSKVEGLMASEGLDHYAGWAMQMDPASQWVVDVVRYGF